MNVSFIEEISNESESRLEIEVIILYLLFPVGYI